MIRLLAYFPWSGGNSTNFDFDSTLQPAEDVSVDAVVSSLFFNSVVFVFLMGFYECLRRLLPTVYSSRKRMPYVLPERQEGDQYVPPFRNGSEDIPQNQSRDDSLASLPDDMPLDWVGPVFGIPWVKVRKLAGLDGYFFLRYIRMNIRITAVSTFWFFLILVPIYATGNGNPYYPAQGWYHLSASNLPVDGWRM